MAVHYQCCDTVKDRWSIKDLEETLMSFIIRWSVGLKNYTNFSMIYLVQLFLLLPNLKVSNQLSRQTIRQEAERDRGWSMMLDGSILGSVQV